MIATSVLTLRKGSIFCRTATGYSRVPDCSSFSMTIALTSE